MKANLEKGTKVCSRCREELPVDNFGRRKVSNDGLDTYCRVCLNQIERGRRVEKRKLKPKAKLSYKFCCVCKVELSIGEFHKDSKNKDGTSSRCKACKKKYYKEYYELNKTQINQHSNTYYQLPQRKYYDYRHNSNKRSREFALTFDQFMTFWQKPCRYCTEAIPTIGLDRLDNTKGYLLTNIVPCCSECNRIRSNKFTYQEMITCIGPALQEVKKLRQGTF